MDIRKSLATEAYAKMLSAAGHEPLPKAAEDAAAQFLESFSNTLSGAEATAKAAMVGEADPHALVFALASSQTAVETVVAVRDKVVEAYQEILRMPV